MLENFDLPPMSPSCLERSESTVAPQALNLMNNGTVRELAGYFAGRLQTEAGTNTAQQVERAYWIALSRAPSDEERQASLKALARFAQLAPHNSHQALTEFCHMLINSAAFLYID